MLNTTKGKHKNSFATTNRPKDRVICNQNHCYQNFEKQLWVQNIIEYMNPTQIYLLTDTLAMQTLCVQWSE